MAEAEDRILQYEQLLLSSDPERAKELERGIQTLLNAVKKDLSVSLRELSTQINLLGEEDFRIGMNPKTGPISVLYPLINNVEQVCMDITALKRNKKYEKVAEAAAVLAKGFSEIKQKMLAGLYKRKVELVKQYLSVVNSGLKEFDSAKFKIAA